MLIQAKIPKTDRLPHTGNEESRGPCRPVERGGARSEFVAIFRALPVTAPGPALAAYLAGKPAFEAVLIHSARGATILSRLAAGSGKTFDVAAISGAAATPLAAIAHRTVIASAPNEQSLLSALARLDFRLRKPAAHAYGAAGERACERHEDGGR